MCVCVYKKDLALYNLQWFICYRTQSKQIIHIFNIYV